MIYLDDDPKIFAKKIGIDFMHDVGPCKNCAKPKSFAKCFVTNGYKGIEYYCGTDACKMNHSEVVMITSTKEKQKEWDDIFSGMKNLEEE